MNARDELDEIHTRLMADVKQHPDYVANHFGSIYGYSEGAEHALDTVRALGYVKHRTITTVEELDALPVESAVLSGMGNVYVKNYDLDDPTAIWWVTAGAVSEFPSISITLPATVLYEPEAQP